MAPDQLAPDAPGPGESQAAYERRVGIAPADTGAGADVLAPPQTTEELRAALEESEARDREQGAQQQAAALGAQPGPPAGAAAAALGGSGPSLPADLAQAHVGALGTGAAPQDPGLEITHTEPVLAQGATGDAVQRLVKLLAHAGYASNTIVNADPVNPSSVLDASVMADVQRFWSDHPEARESDQLYQGREKGVSELQGNWVGPHTWQVLYNLAAAG